MFAPQLHLITLALILGAGAAQGQGQISSGGSAALQPSLVSFRTTHDALAAQFRRLAVTATGTAATTTDRQALARFVRRAIVPRLQNESFELITVFDSLVGGGYAVPATLFDLDGIDWLVKEIERTAGSAEHVAFNERVYAVSVALEGYFTKLQLLVLPVLNARLGEAAMGQALTRLEARRSAR